VTGTHRHDRRLAAGAALDDLAPREQARWARLESACEVCRSLEQEIGALLEDLALAAPRRMPPPAVLDRIRATIAAEADPR
jgi:hypothetical protein